MLIVEGDWFSRDCIRLVKLTPSPDSVMLASPPGSVKKSYLMNRKERGELPMSFGDAEREMGGAGGGSLHFQDFVFFLSPLVLPRERCCVAIHRAGLSPVVVSPDVPFALLLPAQNIKCG